MPQDGAFSTDLDTLSQRALKGATEALNPQDTSFFKESVDRLRDINKKQDAAAESDIKEMEKAHTEGKAATDKALAAESVGPDDLKPWTQKPRQRDPLETFGSMGSIFAIAASAFTHTPMINALNGSAAAMNAIQAGDRQAYQDAFEAWKENTKLALDRHRMEHESFLDVRNAARDNMDSANALWAAHNARFGDQAGEVMREAGLMEKWVQARTSANNAALQMVPELPRIEKFAEQHDAMLQWQEEFQKNNRRPPTAQEKLAQRQKIEMAWSTSSSFSKEQAAAVEDLVAGGMPRVQAIHQVQAGHDKQIQSQVAGLDSAGAEVDDLLGSIDKLQQKSFAGVAGLGGAISRGEEFIKTVLPGSEDASTLSAHEFESKIQAIKLQLPKLLTGTSRSAADERIKVEEILGGISPGTDVAIVKKQLQIVKGIIDNRRRILMSGGEDTGSAPSTDFQNISDDELKRRLGLP